MVFEQKKENTLAWNTNVFSYVVDSKAKYSSTENNIGIAIYHNVFGIIINNIDDYEEETYRQTKCATYNEIRALVKHKYDLHVSNANIADTKGKCGLEKSAYKGCKASGQYSPPKLKPQSEKRLLRSD